MRQGTTVHLIDDDAAILDSLGLYLESKGFTVHRYGSASAAAAIEVGAADSCIVTDVRMPGMSGLELQEDLKRRGATIPIILITGHGDIAMAVSAIKSGAHDFLEKPFDERRLVATIEEAVSARRRHEATESLVADLCRRHRELSERQQQVMKLAIEGRTNKEIGAALSRS